MIRFNEIFSGFFNDNSIINEKIYKNIDISFETLEESLSNKPKTLFKYFTDEIYNEESIANNTIYCNNPKNFNDPYDCGFTIAEINEYEKMRILFWIESCGVDTLNIINSSIENLVSILADSLYNNNFKFKNYTDNEFIKLQLEIFETELQIPTGKESDNNSFEVLRKFIKIKLEKEMDSHFISCFSSRNDNLLLWSHYTLKHKGYCIEYDISKNENKLEINLFPVIYTLQKKRLSEVKNNYLMDITNNLGNLYTDLLLRKSYHWMYENEWRLIVQEIDGNRKNDGVIVDFMPIKSIYFGLNMATKRKKELYLKFSKKDIKFYVMKMNDSNYLVNYEEYKI